MYRNRFGMLFVLDPRIPGNTPDACLRNRSIGLSPPRLHYGRAANYGSIISLRACHGLPPVAVRLRLHRFDRSPFGSWRTCRSGSGSPLSSENVSGGCIFSFQGSWLLSLSNNQLGTFFEKCRKILCTNFAGPPYRVFVLVAQSTLEQTKKPSLHSRKNAVRAKKEGLTVSYQTL